MFQLTTVRQINTALERYVLGSKGNPIYCELDDFSIHRIRWSRTVRGQLQVKLLHTGKWVHPTKVYQ